MIWSFAFGYKQIIRFFLEKVNSFLHFDNTLWLLQGPKIPVLPTLTYIELKPGPKKCSGFKAPSGRCIVLFLTRDLGFVICVVYFTLLFSLIMCAGKECKSISPRTTTSYLKMTRMNLNGIQIARPQIKQTKQMNPNGSKDLQSKARAPKRSLKF